MNRKNSVLVLLTTLLTSACLTLLMAVPASAAVRYAKPTASGTGACTSWANACTLATAMSGAVANDEIWAMAGTHSPGTGATDTFAFPGNSIKVFGGFAGNETARHQRNWSSNVTILDGKSVNLQVASVGTALKTVNGAVLDGLTITGGNASTINGNKGGGLIIKNNSSVLLSNLIVKGNAANQEGGGIYSDSSTVNMANCVVSGNSSGTDGGGVALNASTANLYNVNMYGNTNGGLYRSGASGTVSIYNTIFWGNTVYDTKNSASSGIAFAYGISQFACSTGTTCTSVKINQNPLFSNAAGGDFRLLSGSPGIDACSNSYGLEDTNDLNNNGNTTEKIPYDLAGNSRYVDHPNADTGIGTAPIIDMGAYEAYNYAPTASTIANLTINEDGATTALAFIIGDAETAAASLTVTGSSGNTTLVPNANIVLGGSGASHTVTVTPAANQSGSAVITVTVSDGSLTASASFTLTVTAVNDAPTISTIANQTINEDGATSALAFTVADVETAATSLTVTGSSSNTGLVPVSNIVFGGSGANRAVTVTPAANQNGSALITITVSDGILTTSTSFTLTVNAVNDAPTISTIANQTINEDGATSALAFTVADVETAAASLTLSATSGNTTLVPVANIVFGGSGASRTVTVTPAANQSGTALITITVSDGSLTASSSFTLTVTAVNDAPTITTIANQTINEDGATSALAFTVADVETATASLTLSATSGNTTLVPVSNIVFGGSGASRTVTVTPVANQNGSALITITVSDGSLTASSSFTLTVTAVNDVPTITTIANQTINQDGATSALAFTVADVETAAASLTLTASSSNTGLVPVANIVFGGSGASRTVTVTPVANQSGSATITVTVSDGSLTASTSFTLTVNPKPDTAIDSYPIALGNARLNASSFTFHSSLAGSTFECSLDGGAYGACTSPKAYGALAAGSHTFSVRGDKDGLIDATPATATWTVEPYLQRSSEVPNNSLTGNGTKPQDQASAFDAAGNLHVVYSSFFKLVYQRWGAATGVWETTILDDNIGSPTHSIGHVSLAVDSAGHPHIAFHRIVSSNGMTTGLFYATWNGSAWSITPVDPSTSSTDYRGFCNSIAVDSLGRPHISYNTGTYLQNPVVKYARFDGAAWNIQTVDATGSFSSLALNSTGNPLIAYQDPTAKTLKLAQWSGSA